MSSTISLCMIVRNEAQNISKLLPHMVGFFDETIVVDQGSEDNTAEIARSLGCEVIYTDEPIQGLARNTYLDRAKSDWIYSLDADEWVELADLVKLRTYLDTPDEKPRYGIGTRYEYVGEGSWASIYLGRLYRNSHGIHYAPVRAHPYIVYDDGVQMADDYAILPVSIHHLDILLGDRTVDKRIQRVERLNQEKAENPTNFAPYMFAALEYLAAGDLDAAETEFEAAYQREQNSALLNQLRGQFSLKVGRFDEVKTIFVKQISDGARFYLEDSHTKLAEMHMLAGEYTDAVAHIEAAVRLSPSWPSHYLNLASVELARGHFDAAYTYCLTALSHNPRLLNPILYKHCSKNHLFTTQISLFSDIKTVFDLIIQALIGQGKDQTAAMWRSKVAAITAYAKQCDINSW